MEGPELCTTAPSQGRVLCFQSWQSWSLPLQSHPYMQDVRGLQTSSSLHDPDTALMTSSQTFNPQLQFLCFMKFS